MASKVEEARRGVNVALERAMRCVLPSSTDTATDAGDAFDGAVRVLIAAVREECQRDAFVRGVMAVSPGEVWTREHAVHASFLAYPEATRD